MRDIILFIDNKSSSYVFNSVKKKKSELSAKI